jgi:hypothetical protein
MIKLSNEAQYIDAILCETNCLSIVQIKRLLLLYNRELPLHYASGVAKQLCYAGRAVMRDKDVLVPMYIDAPEADPDMLAAVDIMLDLLRERPAAISSRRPPFKLVFQPGRDDSAYAVAIVKKGLEGSFSLPAELLTVVFLLEDLSQAELIKTAAPYYFAVFEENRLRYYRGG